MPMALWLAIAALGPCDQPPARSVEIVCAYVVALEALDHDRMAAFWLPTTTSTSVSGETTLIDRDGKRAIRAFERAVNTRWTSRIESVAGDSITVTLTEANDFYDALGVGLRTQIESYVVHDGHIARTITHSYAHAGGDYLTAYQAFKRWVLTTDAVRDTTLVNGSVLRFTGESAEHMKPWLYAWRALRQR